MSRTGHRSTAVRSYKRPSSTLAKSVSDALQPPRVPEPDGKKKKVGNDTVENEVDNERAASSSSCLVNIKHGETTVSFRFG